MIKIRTKLFIYFVMILILTIAFSLIHRENEQEIRNLHIEHTQHSLLLNEIAEYTTETYQTLLIYVDQPLQVNLHEFEKSKRKLQSATENLVMKTGKTANYLQLLESFIVLSEGTIEKVNVDNIAILSTYLNDVEKLSNYIDEKTLILLKEDLTNYQEIIPYVERKIEYTKKLGVMILVAMGLFSILYALWFSNGITTTINKLTASAGRISKGNYHTEDVVVPKRDELWFLTKTFNEMKHNIAHSVQQIEEKAKLAQQLKEMELRSLQNQMNPHFLFNTLNVISKLSFIEGAERTSDLITSVSTLLRYNIGKMDRPTTLKNEVEIVKEYFFIQKARFGDRVKFIESIDETCVDIAIPCLTLQPIVENAFIHGIEEMVEDAIIELRIYREEKRVVVEVSDNGVGMDAATIERIFSEDEQIESQKSTGIGLSNVISRLQLFNDQASILIQSEINQGTLVTIQLSEEGEESA